MCVLNRITFDVSRSDAGSVSSHVPVPPVRGSSISPYHKPRRPSTPPPLPPSLAPPPMTPVLLSSSSAAAARTGGSTVLHRRHSGDVVHLTELSRQPLASSTLPVSTSGRHFTDTVRTQHGLSYSLVLQFVII